MLERLTPRTMCRFVLAAYMLLLSLTGPTSCCCSLARFAATITTLGNLGEPARLQVPGCCQSPSELAGAENRRADGPGSDHGQPGPKLPSHRCKCVKNLCGGVPSQKLEVVIDQSRSLVDDLWLDLAAPLLLVADELLTPVAYFADTPPALLSGREIRVALCSWRC